MRRWIGSTVTCRQPGPGRNWEGSSQFSGDNPLGMGEGAQALADIGELEQLAEQLSAGLSGRDDGRRSTSDALARQLGDQAAIDAQTLSELERALVNQGFLDRSSDGQWRLSPKAMRRLGETAITRCGAATFEPPRRTRNCDVPEPRVS